MEKSSLKYIVFAGAAGYVSFSVEKNDNLRYMNQEERPLMRVIMPVPAKLISISNMCL